MTSRWYSVAVVLLWLASMGWLVTEKVLPTLLIGEPPNCQTILDSQRYRQPECWVILWNDQPEPLGWAASMVVPLPHQMREVRSRVHFQRLPLAEMMPGLMAAFEKMVGPLDEFEEHLEWDLHSRLVFGPFGTLSRFESWVGTPFSEDLIKVRGQVADGVLSVAVHTGGITIQAPSGLLPQKRMVGDALAPQLRLPGLRRGQSWTIETYSPLQPPTSMTQSPLELLQATVEGTEPTIWNDRQIEAWLVVLRSDPGASASEAKRIRGRLWVHPDGTVLRQEVQILRGTLCFVRMSDRQARALAGRVDFWEEGEGDPAAGGDRDDPF